MALQIKVHADSDKLTTVTWSVFRSWSGERYVNGRRFFGRRFYYLSHERCYGPNADEKA